MMKPHILEVVADVFEPNTSSPTVLHCILGMQHTHTTYNHGFTNGPRLVT